MSASLKLKPNATSRVLGGHPWVFANECEALLPAEHDGEVVECRDRTGRFLGTGIYNSKSQIVWRRLSRDRVTLDAAYLRAALTKAIDRRAEGEAGSPLPAGDVARSGVRALPFQRLVWSESDDLPGVVADQFGDTLVVQIQTLAMEKRAAALGDLLAELTGAKEIIFRNDANIRKLEGLPSEVHTRSGAAWAPRWVKIDGLDYWLDLQGGQKTGFYLDQRLQHAVVAKYAAGKRVLDAFCNQGSFALHCAKAGAASVLGLDSAFDAVGQAKKNADRNGLKAEFTGANVFDWFTAQRDAAPAWDLIILDPPPFAKSKSALEGALRGYKELNLRAMKSLMSGGVLATYTCSHHMQDAQLREILAEAAADAKRRVHVLEFCHQPADHPVLVTMPESEYLRGYILRVE
ncbi:class I SAM-dependent rRNA methyltransferase [Opitutus sp. GAS368]|jgi:23S rRNA (cytosine1962-C5)-methyltransferase|uniref:class I SAM-dependent rRNA methyltransferase n=1 Tax=Opitutus sp. GAS368 TaxID=1882749 RepID=UPI00087C6ECF|nr:class I SAM-dependent rRNA methyltransferase [Opitutus sp. GAS368]SDR65337.1 SAM-dependent methyltransferase [Opitutus sp. GAS368]